MIRLTGGEFRGRALQTPPTLKTRPTQAKLRQALFNSLQTLIPEARVLDLFAGSGALGFEALSRGATEVVFVESDRSVCKLIEKNAGLLGVNGRMKIHSESAIDFGKRLKSSVPFDLVLADPPYAEGWEPRLLDEFPWESALAPGGVFCLEWSSLKSRVDSLPEETPFLVKVREKNYGDSVLTTFRRKD